MNLPAATESVRPIRLIAAILLVAALFFTRDILMPAAMAVLLAFLLNPVVSRLRRWGLNRVAAVAITVSIAGILLAGMGYVVAHQLIDLTTKLPDYKENLRTKVREFRSSSGTTLSKLSGTYEELRQELSSTQPTTQTAMVESPVGPILRTPAAPMRVEVVDNDLDFGQIATTFAAPLLVPLAAIGIVILLLIFLLIHSDDIRERVITFAGIRQVSLTTATMDEAGTRIGQFLRMQAFVNLCYGAMVAIGLLCFGVPNALLWGVIGFLLRFIPYLGPWLAAAMPTLLTFAVFPSWTRSIGVISMFAVVEFTTNMILEPVLYSNSSGISSLGVVCATIFWAWVWGPVGMILAVPITSCLVVMGKHVPQLALLHQLFGTDVSVPIVGKLYQRLLVGDDGEIEEIVSREVKSSSLAAVCDNLLLPVLAELKRDAIANVISATQVRVALRILTMLCDTEAPATQTRPRLLSIASQNEFDDCAATLIVCAARKEGVAAEMISSHALAREAAEKAVASGASTFLLVQVPPQSLIHHRRLVKLFQSKLTDHESLIELMTPISAPLPAKVIKPTDVETKAKAGPVETIISRLREKSDFDTSQKTLTPAVAQV